MVPDEDEIYYEEESEHEEEVRESLEGVGDNPLDTVITDIPEYPNPLNPKTFKNLEAIVKASKARSYAYQPPPISTGKRFTHIRVHTKYLSDSDPTVIEVKTKPDLGFNYDQVVSVDDISSSIQPTSNYSANIALSGWSTNSIVLEYSAQSIANEAYTSNLSKDIKLTYASGHTEVFTVLFPVVSPGWLRTHIKDNAGNDFNPDTYNLYGQSISSCGSSIPHYSTSMNSADHYKDAGPAAGDHYIFSKYHWVHDPSGSGAEAEWLSHNYSSSASDKVRSFNFGNNGIQPTNIFGVNGVITPDDQQLSKQEIHRLDIILTDPQQVWADFNSEIGGTDPATLASNMQDITSQLTWLYADKAYVNSTTGQAVVNASTQWAALYGDLAAKTTAMFSYNIWYTENITDCVDNRARNYTVCQAPGNPNYFLTTSKDCSGATIPTDDLPGGANYINGLVNYVHDDACCTKCDLSVSVLVGDSTYGGDDGEIFWTTADPPWTSYNNTGTPWTSGGMYTVTLTASTGATLAQTMAPAGGSTFTVGSGATTNNSSDVTCASSDQITTGMQVSGTNIPAGSYVGHITPGAGTIGTNVTGFSLVDGTGNTVFATGTSSGLLLTFATGISGTFGSLVPNNPGGLGANTYYTLTVTDNDGCSSATLINVREQPSEVNLGCQNNTALNYNSAATGPCVPDCCILCNSTTGKLEDPSGSTSIDIFDSQILTSTSTTNISTTNGVISAQASVVSSVQAYMTFDADETYTFTLYPLTTQGDFATAGTATATQTGIATTTYGGTPQHTFSNLAYGHYAVKMQFVDSGAAVTTENCFSIFFVTVKAKVCDDPLAINYNSSTPSDPLLREHDATLCNYTVACCQLSSLVLDNTNGTLCEPIIESTLTCDPSANTVSVQWEFNGNPIPNSTVTLGSVSSSGVTVRSLQNNTLGQTNWLSTYGSGIYTLKFLATYAGNYTCNSSITYTHSAPVHGCMDTTALNYNSNAVCSDTCAYESYNCISAGNCQDPWTGDINTWVAGTYTGANAYNNCLQDPECLIPVYACTDPCALNYYPGANIDDGSCIYRACLEEQASNYLWSCDCNEERPQATINDEECCINPCEIANSITVGTTNSTGTCTTPLSDGTVVVTVTLNSNATSWTIYYTDNAYNTFNTDTTTYTASGAATTVTGLAPGNYHAIVTDNHGCAVDTIFTIGTTSVTQGCTDPTADNYDGSATCDDGSCLYCGCMDPNATNYDPNATCSDESCIYPTVEINPCVPKNIDTYLENIELCLSLQGTNFLHDYRIGVNTDCSLMDKWKLILINYLFNQSLECLFNCSDDENINTSTPETCEEEWDIGGPVTGQNDQGHAGSQILGGPGLTSGTTVTNSSLYFVQSNTLYFGDVIKVGYGSNSGNIYKMVGAGSYTYGCYDPETSQGQQSGHWAQCTDSNKAFAGTTSVGSYTSSNTAYLDNFLNFANKFCKDCGISIPSPIAKNGNGEIKGGSIISVYNINKGFK